MPREKYIFNQQTQSYQIDRRSVRATRNKTGIVLMAGLGVFLAYYLVMQALDFRSPKALLLERRNRELAGQVELLGGRIEEQEEVLRDLSLRDNLVYRPVFGMAEIPDAVRLAGLPG